MSTAITNIGALIDSDPANPEEIDADIAAAEAGGDRTETLHKVSEFWYIISP